MPLTTRSLIAASAAASLLFTTLAGPVLAADAPVSAAQRLALLQRSVKYVFVIYQENRSFDSYFGTFPNAEGLYSHVPASVAGFEQPLINTDGTMTTIKPFRIGPAQFAADTDDIDHAHSRIVQKMHVVDGVPKMDAFAVTEERKFSPTGNPSLMAKQMGELAMAHEDCDTIPILWNYANRFVLFDHIFQEMTGPSTPGNLAIIAAQTGITQSLLHPEAKVAGNGDTGVGVPVVNDDAPFWGSPSDTTPPADKVPVNATTQAFYQTQINLTFASLPLTLEGRNVANVTQADRDPQHDLPDVLADIADIAKTGAGSPVPWGWYEEGYNREPTDDNAGPTDAAGRHASYVTHHNGPAFFGYIANNPRMRSHLHGLDDFRTAIDTRALPAEGGLYYIKGGYKNILKLKPGNPDPKVQAAFNGDDDHPGYSDAQISEAMVADTINRIARSPYWSQSAIILTWDDSEGDYDHVPPKVRQTVPGEGPLTDGPRVPLIVISPFAKEHSVQSASGDQASVVRFVDELFGLKPLGLLPDELRANAIGQSVLGNGPFWGPLDGPQSGITDLLDAFDDARLQGARPPVTIDKVVVPDAILGTLPQQSGYGCKAIDVVPTDVQLGLPNAIPADFNPRPRTNPSPLP
ncbi:MAG: phosphoesterase [Candidatus Eremiobacteraeota bacterium]|nr:phosphoesterase [Candidatus Eremiobacteraeota bacterium]